MLAFEVKKDGRAYIYVWANDHWEREVTLDLTQGEQVQIEIRPEDHDKVMVTHE